MKKFLSVVLALTMLFSMLTTASADTMKDILDRFGFGGTEPYDVGQLPLHVAARKSGSNGNYIEANEGLELKKWELLDKDVSTSGVGIDYQATLDMSPIKALFDRELIELVLRDDAAKADFYDGTVTTDVTVTITYPKTAVVNEETLKLATTGSLDDNSRLNFVETADRMIVEDGNFKKATIKYKNKDNLKVDDLDGESKVLDDIIFTLNNTIKYNSDGYHNVTVSMSGSTTIAFDNGAQQIVTYSGNSSHILSAATEHKLVVVPVEPATCKEKGWTEGVKCETHDSYVCGAHGLVTPVQIIPQLSHDILFVPVVNATCSSTGVIAHYMCRLCKEDYADESATTPLDKEDLIIGKLDHDDEIIPQIDATCTENGLSAGAVCKVCGHTSERTIIKAKGHTETPIAAINPDCTTPGWTAGKKCSVCHTVLLAPKPIAATGHNFGDWNITLQPTEEETGSKTRTCQNGCGTSETVEIPKLEHVCTAKDEAAVITKAATCTETGLKQNYCACGEPVGEPIIIPAIGHTSTKMSEYIPATCTTEGVLEHWACTNCSGLFTETTCENKITSARIAIDLNNHGSNKVVIPAIEPTCEKDGLTQGEKCVACKKITISQDEVEKTGHTFETIPQSPATCTETGMHEHKHCKVCDKDYALDELTEVTKDDYILPALGHKFDFIHMETSPLPYKPASDTEEGWGKVNCERCDHYKDVPIAKLEHVHNEECEKIITAATCTTNGLKRIVYTCCNDIKQDNIVIYASHSARKIEKVPSTCYKKGVEEHWYCSVCDKLFKDAGCTQETTITELTLAEEAHDFELHHQNDNFIFNKCSKCGDMQKIAKSNKAEVKDNGNDKDKKDKVKEERINEDKEQTGRKVHVYPETNIEDKEISSNLEKEIHKNDTDSKKASEEKVVVDITVDKVTIYVDKTNTKEVHEILPDEILDEERERVPETNTLKKIEIKIPETMRNFADFLVHRMHNGVAQTLTINPDDNDGEYIVIASDKTKVTIFVKKFSEYAVVGYTTKVNPDPVTPSTGGGGSGSSSCTIKLNANGGTLLNNVTVKRGQKAELPVPTRSGYVFAGWYLDSKFTTPFDADTVINRNYTLYAKWVELGECEGTVEDNCPCLKYYDLDPTLWYHRGVDYVLNRGMMIGTADTQFAPDWDVTRAMLVTVLWRAEGKPAAASSTFTDLEDGLYYVDAVNWAAANGVVNGYSETAFAPNDAITREQFAAIMYRYAKDKGYDVSVGENTNILSYSDYSEISEYAIPAMQYTAGSGLIKGRTETTLNPKDNTTRAEMATILYRFFTEQ